MGFVHVHFACLLATINTIHAADVSWTVYHSWNPQQKFIKRGTISFNPENAQNTKPEELLQVTNDQALTTKDIADMLEYGWYHVKLVPSSSSSSNGEQEGAVLGTVPACHLRRSNFKDLFELTLPRTGHQQDALTSFAYTPLISPLAPKTCDDYPEFNKEEGAVFQSRTNVVLDTPGLPLKPILSVSKPPPGLSFLKRPRQSKADAAGSSGDSAYEDPNEHAKPEPPSGIFGYLQKYWYIVLPMVLMQFLAPPPEEGQPSQQQQGARAPQQGGAAPAAAAGGGSPGKKAQRRGKRS